MKLLDVTKNHQKAGRVTSLGLPFVGHNHPFFGRYLPSIAPFVGHRLPLAIPIKSKSRCKGQTGFTLAELMIVLAIIAISLTLGAPSFTKYLRSHQVKSTTNDLLLHINLARNEAIKRGVYVNLCRSGDPLADNPVCGGTPDTWTSGWLVYAMANGVSTPADYNSGADTLITTHEKISSRTIINFYLDGNNDYLSFKPDGTLNGAGTNSAVYGICDSDDKENGGKKITIRLLGRPYAEDAADQTDCDSPSS